MLSILVNKFHFKETRWSRYWYITALTNYEMVQLLKVKTPITHPTYYKIEELENELNKGIIRTITAVYIEHSFNPQNLYKLLKK